MRPPPLHNKGGRRTTCNLANKKGQTRLWPYGGRVPRLCEKSFGQGQHGNSFQGELTGTEMVPQFHGEKSLGLIKECPPSL